MDTVKNKTKIYMGQGWGEGEREGVERCLIRIDLFLPSKKESKQEVTKVVSLVQNGGESTKCIQSP